MILFLDFDGVLHGGDVYVIGRHPELRGPGHLIEHAHYLTDGLADYPRASIVLSTNWIPHLGFDRTKRYLPPELQRRVIGATWHSRAGLHRREWIALTRYYQVSNYIERHGLIDWLAIDDLHEGSETASWPASRRDRLILTDPDRGLSDPAAMAALRAALAAAHEGASPVAAR